MWVSLAALGSCQLHFDNVSWHIQCLLACRRFNLCFDKQEIFGRFPRKQTWPAVVCTAMLCSRPSILLISSTIGCSLWLISTPLLSESNQRKNRRENCSTSASQSGCVHLRSIERARYVTKHLRDTDSDYVMKKPSRCWLGAVPRYWKVFASCFQNVSFAENTSAPLPPRARIFQPILLLSFLFSCSWICLQNSVSDFFYSVSKFSGVQKKTEFA